MKKENTDEMREEYDFSGARKNPYAGRLRKQITINLNVSAIEYFKQKALETGIPYQTLINLYLADCVKNKKYAVITLESVLPGDRLAYSVESMAADFYPELFK